MKLYTLNKILQYSIIILPLHRYFRKCRDISNLFQLIFLNFRIFALKFVRYKISRRVILRTTYHLGLRTTAAVLNLWTQSHAEFSPTDTL